MIADLKLSCCFSIAQLFLLHGFYNHSLELRRISFVWYSFWHRITPHSLVQVFYHTCLTNGVQFNTKYCRDFVILSERKISRSKLRAPERAQRVRGQGAAAQAYFVYGKPPQRRHSCLLCPFGRVFSCLNRPSGLFTAYSVQKIDSSFFTQSSTSTMLKVSAPVRIMTRSMPAFMT